MSRPAPERTPEQQIAIDRAKRGCKGWFGRVTIPKTGEFHRAHMVVPVGGRVVRR